jgi:hypothetical protein
MSRRIAPPVLSMDQHLQGLHGMSGVGQVEDQERDPFFRALTKELDQWLATATITTTLPAHNAQPYWSLPIDVSSSVTMAAAVQAPNVWTTALTYTAPTGWFGRISGYGVNVRDATYTWNSSLIWRILVNGQPVPSLANWGQQRGTIYQPRETYILVRPEQRLDFQVRRDVTWGGAAQIVEHALVGYSYSPRTQVDGSRSSMVV